MYYCLLSIHNKKPQLQPVSALHNWAPGISALEFSCDSPVDHLSKNKRQRTPRDLGGMTTQTLWSNPEASHAPNPGKDKPGHILQAVLRSLDMSSSRKPLPLLNSIREHGHEAHPAARPSPMHMHHQDQMKGWGKPQMSTQPVLYCRCVSTSCL